MTMTVGLVLTTLRLHRMQIAVTAALLTVLVVSFLISGQATASFIAEPARGSCAMVGCDAAAVELSHRYEAFGSLLPYLGLLPAAVGAFWGAPLLGREYETGTASFSWTQSVTRRSWIRTRVIVLSLLVATGGLILGTTVDFWLSSFGGFELPGVEADFGFSQIRGFTPAGWWLFGFALGAVSGAILRRTVAAIAVTVAVVVATLIVRNLWFGLATEGENLGAAVDRLQYIETAAMITASLLLTVMTCWSVEHARA